MPALQVPAGTLAKSLCFTISGEPLALESLPLGLCELPESFDPSRPGQGLIFRPHSPLSLYPNSASSSWPLGIQCSGTGEPKKVKPKEGEPEQLAHITHSGPSVSGPSGILMMGPGLLPKEEQHWAYQLWGSQKSPTRSQEEGLQGEHSV